MGSSLDLNSKGLHELNLLWHHAVKRDTHAIGWLPTEAFTNRHESGGLSTVFRGTELVGWAMHARSPSRGVMKIYQIWVREDARILEHGRALITRVNECSLTENCWLMEAWVADDLPANAFWEAIGFQKKNWRYGRKTSSRRHYRWVAHVIPTHHNKAGGRFAEKMRWQTT